MQIISQLLAYLGALCTSIISTLGYPGIVLLMTMESMIVPIPSELVMPFAGYLVATGDMSFVLVILFSSLGSVLGSLLSYYIGFYGGGVIVQRYGKYVLLSDEDLEATHRWFRERGEITVFISRFVPVVRHLISIPAGMGGMNKKKFLLYTLLGATAWNTILAYAGYALGKNWEIVKQYSEYVSIPVFIILVILFCYFVWRHLRRKKKRVVDQTS